MNEELSLKELVDALREQMKEFGSPEAELTLNFKEFDLKVIVTKKGYLNK